MYIRMYRRLKSGNKLQMTVAEGVLFSALPIVISLIKMIVGRLAFDPLFVDISRLSKKLRCLEKARMGWEAKRKALIKKREGEIAASERWRTHMANAFSSMGEAQKLYAEISVNGSMSKRSGNSGGKSGRPFEKEFSI